MLVYGNISCYFTWWFNNFDFAFTFKNIKRCFQNYCHPWKYHCTLVDSGMSLLCLSLEASSTEWHLVLLLRESFSHFFVLGAGSHITVSCKSLKWEMKKNIENHRHHHQEEQKILQIIYQSNNFFFLGLSYGIWVEMIFRTYLLSLSDMILLNNSSL